MRTHLEPRSVVIAAVIVLIACGVGCAAIAGIDGASSTSQTTSDAGKNNNTLTDADPSAEGSSGGDAGDDAASEDPSPTFECGTLMTCVAGQQACCVESPTVTRCEAVASGCPQYDAGSGNPLPDAGGPGGPNGPLLCESYKNCPGLFNCCWDPKAGSSCLPNPGNCPMKQEPLCMIGFDLCGGTLCTSFPNSPQNNVGHCAGKPKP